VSRNSDNTSQISVAFPLGSLTNAVGASVLAGTVASASGTNPPNRADEVASSATSTTVAPGATAAPDLTGVLIAKTNNSFGQLATTSVLYSFDSNITSTVDVTKLFLHLSDGSRLVCIGFVTTTGGTVAFGLGSGNSAVPPNSAACVAYTFVAGQAGTNSGSATAAQVATGVLGTVNNGAVVDASGNQTPEGAKVTAGSNGTPAS
jgi:hypothetical protein